MPFEHAIIGWFDLVFIFELFLEVIVELVVEVILVEVLERVWVVVFDFLFLVRSFFFCVVVITPRVADRTGQGRADAQGCLVPILKRAGGIGRDDHYIGHWGLWVKFHHGGRTEAGSAQNDKKTSKLAWSLARKLSTTDSLSQPTSNLLHPLSEKSPISPRFHQGARIASCRLFPFHTFLGVEPMIKKILLGSALAVGCGGLLLGTSSVSYVKTGYHSLRDSIKEQIPIEVEIKRARDMITGLKPEILDNLKLIAREEVEVAKLQREVNTKQASLAKSKDAILKLKDDVQSGVQYVTYKGKKYNIDQVRQDLGDRFKHHQTLEATTDKLEKILEAREKNLLASRRKLDEMLAAKRELEVQVENLQARLTMVEVAQAGSRVAVDDSALGSVRQVLDEISTRIDVAEKMVQCFDESGSVPVNEEPSSEDLVDQISSYFSEGTAEVSVEQLAGGSL